MDPIDVRVEMNPEFESYIGELLVRALQQVVDDVFTTHAGRAEPEVAKALQDAAAKAGIDLPDGEPLLETSARAISRSEPVVVGLGLAGPDA